MTLAVERVGRYRILSELGRGAMGIVYRAEDPAIGRTVAVKTIRLGDFSDPAERERLRERLFREARSAGVLSHPNIVTIYDIAEENETAFVFMEFVDGQALEQMLASGAPLHKRVILDVLRQTAAALDYAHQKGVVHRDIKPANIMVSRDGEVKITDFGVARIVSQQMTQAGTILGTPNYMSPEQIQGIPVDGRSDQYSLAVVAYEMLTGEKPHAADSLPALLYKIAKEEPAAPRRLNPTLPPEADTVFERALAKDPARRYANCTEFVEALTAALQAGPDWQPMHRGGASSLETVASAPETPAPTLVEPPAQTGRRAAAPLPRARRRPLEEKKEPSPVRAAVVILLILVAAGLGVFVWREYGVPEPLLTQADVAPPQAPSATPPVAAEPSVPKVQPPQPPSKAPVAAERGPAPPQSADAAPPKRETPRREPAAKPRAPRTAAPREPSPAVVSPAEYSVAVRSKPAGATVVSDLGSSCRTPCSLLLREGRRTLTASAPAHRTASRSVQVPDELEVNFELEPLAGTLTVVSNPPGASILINGRLRPEKTPAKISLPAGTYKITVQLEGRPPLEDTVQVRDQVITTFKVDW
jgi:serine/threonine-protein kinase